MLQNHRIDVPIFEWGKRTYVMGIINVTPDSFSGDGLLPSPQNLGSQSPPHRTGKREVASALEQARRFVSAGADILDVGGESTRPGSVAVSAREEAARVIPVIRALAEEFPKFPISIDTYKAEIAQAAIEAGATIVNDVWGLRADPELGEVAAHHGVPVILMHNRSKPANADVEARLGGRYVGVQYDDLIEDIKQELLESVALAHNAGIADKNIILDPGIGFGKTVSQNLELLNRLDEIRALGYPVLLGPSRKSFIGYTLDAPPVQRVEGTAATIAVGIVRGADIVRVHDVEAMVRVAKMTDAIVRARVQ
jgi:dihydropteroate synthase